MNADSTYCDDIRLELSARLDGEVDRETSERIDAHLATCAACRAHEEALRSVKRAVALQAAPAVPDLAPEIMRRVSGDLAGRRHDRRSYLRTAVAAAAVTLLVLSGALLPWQARPDIAVASEITRAVRSAATEITTYHAEFDITERGWHADVPERHFAAEIWFEAPEHFRMEVRDLTPYPGDGWPTNDATLIAGPSTWWLRETASCPAPALPGCAISPRPEIRALRNRQPFDGTTVVPTDLILPLETLAETDGLTVVGRESVGGRDAHHVVLESWQAAPLIESLQVAGTWERFPARSRVDLWLDAETWFPLRFVVRGDTGSLEVTTTSFEQPERLATETFAAPNSGTFRDGGFRRAPALDRPLPTYVAGLDAYRAGTTSDGHTVDTFVNGMTWMKVLTDDATEPTLTTFTSELVALGDDGYAYYRPSSDSLRRTIEVIGREERVRLESNLARSALVDVAASVPIEGVRFDHLRTDSGTVMRIDGSALADHDYAVQPSYLPEGFRFSSAFVSRSTGGEQLVAYYRPGESAPLTGEVRVTQAPAIDVLPPTSEDLRTVEIAPGVIGRWSVTRSELEWVDDGRYRSVAVPGFDVVTAIRVAASMAE